MLGSIAVFDVASQGWTTVPVADGRSARFAAAGAYCPCSGKLFAMGGLDASVPGERPSPLSNGVAIQVEQKAQVHWRNGSDRRKSGMLVGTLEFDSSGPSPIPWDVRLMDCLTGRSLLTVDDVRRIGNGRYLIRLRIEDLSGVDQTMRLRIVGKIKGQPLGFIADAGELLGFADHAQQDGQAEQAVPRRGTRELVLNRTRFEFGAVDPGSVPDHVRVDVVDVAGRRHVSEDVFIGDVMSDGRSTITVALPRECGKLKGIYFIQVTWAGETVSRKVLFGK
ncbi:MAG: hypothetical protein ACREOU_13255 [Candidatus Eiseniibacteriota bacterium]